jgi:hypothetical protein
MVSAACFAPCSVIPAKAGSQKPETRSVCCRSRCCITLLPVSDFWPLTSGSRSRDRLATHKSASPGGSGAPISANLWCPRLRAEPRQAPLGAPHAALVGSGPCFTLPAQSRSISQLLAGLRSEPGGSPEPPGSLGLRTRPAGAAPHPACTTPRDDAPQRMR